MQNVHEKSFGDVIKCSFQMSFHPELCRDETIEVNSHEGIPCRVRYLIHHKIWVLDIYLLKLMTLSTSLFAS
jgi:hypothetical protein